MAKFYINHQYTDLDYWGRKEKEPAETWEEHETEEQARESIRELNWKYNREVYHEKTKEFFRVHNFWISRRATKKYYQKK